MALFQEIRSLSDLDYASLIEHSLAVGKAPPKKFSRSKSKSTRPSDSPVLRVAKILREKRSLNDQQAIVWLRNALLEDGVQATRIPQASDADLEAWLDKLFNKVSSAVVFDIANTNLD